MSYAVKSVLPVILSIVRIYITQNKILKLISCGLLDINTFVVEYHITVDIRL